MLSLREIVRLSGMNENLPTAGRRGSTVIREIKSYIPNFQCLSIHYARREANDAAHCCAKEGLVTASSVVTYDVIPEFLIATMQSDVTRLIIE